MSDYYQGKTAVITGGASGVGRSIAFGLGRAGATVVIGDVDASDGSDCRRSFSGEYPASG